MRQRLHSFLKRGRHIDLHMEGASMLATTLLCPMKHWPRAAHHLRTAGQSLIILEAEGPLYCPERSDVRKRIWRGKTKETFPGRKICSMGNAGHENRVWFSSLCSGTDNLPFVGGVGSVNAGCFCPLNC